MLGMYVYIRVCMHASMYLQAVRGLDFTLCVCVCVCVFFRTVKMAHDMACSSVLEAKHTCMTCMYTYMYVHVCIHTCMRIYVYVQVAQGLVYIP